MPRVLAKFIIEIIREARAMKTPAQAIKRVMLFAFSVSVTGRIAIELSFAVMF